MRVLAAAVAALSLAGAAAAATVAAPTVSSAARTQLAISVWPDGRGGPSLRWTLRCAPVGGTLPTRRRACALLARLSRPFAPVPADAVCAEVYGGPQEALVRGRHRGRRVWARFDRRDACRTERWDNHRALFPVGT